MVWVNIYDMIVYSMVWYGMTALTAVVVVVVKPLLRSFKQSDQTFIQ